MDPFRNLSWREPILCRAKKLLYGRAEGPLVLNSKVYSWLYCPAVRPGLDIQDFDSPVNLVYLKIRYIRELCLTGDLYKEESGLLQGKFGGLSHQ